MTNPTSLGDEIKLSWGAILRKAAFSDDYSPILRKRILVPLVASPLIIGVLVALATQNVEDSSFIEQLWIQISESLSLRDAFFVGLLLLVIFLIDLSVSAGRLGSSKFNGQLEKSISERERFQTQLGEQELLHSSQLSRERAEFAEEIALKDQIILDEKATARIDRTTGVPNELSLHDQMATLIRPGVVLIMVDIVNFGAFNTKFSTGTANTVLKEIAQYMFRNSRRVEHIFRMMEDEGGGTRIVEDNGWTFRLHRRGDEFLIILNGGEMDALGFLNRLRKETQTDTSRISKAGAKDILFYAGVFAVSGSIGPAESLHYVDKALSAARSEPDQGRVVWHSGKSHETLEQQNDEADRAFQFRQGLYKSFSTEDYWRGRTPIADREQSMKSD